MVDCVIAALNCPVHDGIIHMLQAILQGKAGRVQVNGKIQSWRELFRLYEDLLTAVFFGRLHYLSPHALHNILNVLLPDVDVSVIGELQSIEYWPKHDGVENRSYVEPDVLMQFTKAKLLVEVKRPMGVQWLSQWENEINALLVQEEVSASDRLIFLALGGLRQTWKDDISILKHSFPDLDLTVCAIDWDAVSDAVFVLLDSSEDDRDRKVYEDWLAAFHLYGIRLQVRPFAQLGNATISSDWRALMELMSVSEKPYLTTFINKDWEQLNKFRVRNCEVMRLWR